jgi:DSBA-like thioredoxin domain
VHAFAAVRVGRSIADVTFFFDPLCPWTWRASRWLVTVADARHLDVEWRSFSLKVLHVDEDEDVPAPLDASTVALRLVESLAAAGRHQDAGCFFSALGRRIHDEGMDIDLDLIRAAAEEAGVGDAIGALDDRRWNAAILEAYAQALDTAGPDIGSPVVMLAGCERGLHGPILGTIPDREDALAIWDAMTVLLRTPTFYELKRGRPDETDAA